MEKRTAPLKAYFVRVDVDIGIDFRVGIVFLDIRIPRRLFIDPGFSPLLQRTG
jgi:hypothetical protein